MINVGDIEARLPYLKGRLVADAPLKRLSWFRTGGTADLLFEPADEGDLLNFLRALPMGLPITVLGVGSNLLVRDGGVEGVVIRLGRGFAGIEVRGDHMSVGAGAMDVHVARAAQEAGIAGLEFLVGVPGTIGGALRMNAGAYGRELADVLIHCHGVDTSGRLVELEREDMGFSYRASEAPQTVIFTRACLKGRVGDAAQIKARMDEITKTRSESQPIGTRTGGSTFKNPSPEVSEKSAWQLVDEAGCRGLSKGGAQVSDKHTNFLINTGDASAADIEELGEEVRARVLETSGVTLEWEIRRIGRHLGAGAGT